MDSLLDEFTKMCTQLGGSAQVPAQAFRREMFDATLDTMQRNRVRGSVPLAHSSEEVSAWGALHHWFRDEQPEHTKITVLEDFVRGDSRLLLNLWLAANEAGVRSTAFDNLVFSHFQLISNADLLYSQEELGKGITLEKHRLTPTPQLSEVETTAKSAGDLFFEKILLGTVKADLSKVHSADLLAGGSATDDWIEQTMPARRWLSEQRIFAETQLTHAEQGAVKDYKRHKFEVERAVSLFPMLTQITVAAEKLKGWIHARKAWITPPRFDIMWDIFKGLVNDVKKPSKWNALSETKRIANVDRLVSAMDDLRDEYVTLGVMGLHEVIGYLFRATVQEYSAQAVRAFLRVTARDLERLYGILYSLDTVWDRILNDHDRSHFLELLDRDEKPRLIAPLEEGELVALVKELDFEGVQVKWDDVTRVVEGMATMLKQLMFAMKTEMHLSDILLHPQLPLTRRSIVVYRFMEHTLRADQGPWLWRILDDLNAGRPALYFEPGVQSSTYNPRRLTAKMANPPWSVVFSILCPAKSRLFHADYQGSTGESEILIRPGAMLEIFSYRVIPNVAVNWIQFDHRSPWLVILYCTLRAR